MDLNIKDVSELLNVSEESVQALVSDGVIPAYQLNNEFRFSRIEIEDWVMNRKDEEKLETPWSGTLQFSLFRAIHKGDVLIDVGGSTKEEIISTAMNAMAKTHNWDAGVFTDLLLDRESLAPTALVNGIGVPHAREFLVPGSFDVISVVFPESPIEYGALDGKEVHTMFFLFACHDKSHLHLLAKLAHLANNPEALDFLKSKPKKPELLTFIKSWESKINQDAKFAGSCAT